MTQDSILETDPTGTAAELAEFVRNMEAELPTRFLPVVREHYQNLIGLSRVLAAAGHPPEDIQRHVRDLVASYELKLLQAIETEKES